VLKVVDGRKRSERWWLNDPEMVCVWDFCILGWYVIELKAIQVDLVGRAKKYVSMHAHESSHHVSSLASCVHDHFNLLIELFPLSQTPIVLSPSFVVSFPQASPSSILVDGRVLVLEAGILVTDGVGSIGRMTSFGLTCWTISLFVRPTDIPIQT
jgi:hypothetical protein